MLTPTLLRDMHKRVAEAHVRGFVQSSNWTKIKDEPQSFTAPQCWFTEPLGIHQIRERGQVFPGYLIDVRFLMSLADDRSQDARDAAYNAMCIDATYILTMFVNEYVNPSSATFDTVLLDIEIETVAAFEPFIDDGPQNLTGCRMYYTVRDKMPVDCGKLAALFPSLA